MKKHFYTLAAIGISLIASSCGNDEQVSIIPEINYKDHRFSREDLGGIPTDFYYVTFEYVDGDGDIGMADGEDHIPGHPEIKHNLFVDYYEERDGIFVHDVECAIGGAISTKKYVFESITPPGNNKSIKGEITVKLETCETPLDTTKNIKYSFYIIDRGNHQSNVAETPIIAYETQK